MKLRFVFAALLAPLAFTASAQTPNTFVPTGSMTTPREQHTAPLLPNGKSLITGRFPGPAASAELYDPATRLFTLTGNMTTKRGLHTATLLTNGKVLITGGETSDSAGFVGTSRSAE